jgi:hypothetical protein
MFEQDLLFRMGKSVDGGFDFGERAHVRKFWRIKRSRYACLTLISTFSPAEILSSQSRTGIYDPKPDLITENCTYESLKLSSSIEINALVV